MIDKAESSAMAGTDVERLVSIELDAGQVERRKRRGGYVSAPTGMATTCGSHCCNVTRKRHAALSAADVG